MRDLPWMLLGTMLLAGCGVDAAPGGATSGGSGTGASASTGGSGNGGSVGGGTSVDRSCSVSTDCALTSATCCGSCGAPSVSDMIAVRAGQESAYASSVCSPNQACPACASQLNPNLFAVCDGGTCQARDLTAEKAAACSVDRDCVVKPRACCECGANTDSGNLVALNIQSLSFLTETLCEPAVACAECAWVPPAEVTASCANGVCQVNDARGIPF